MGDYGPHVNKYQGEIKHLVEQTIDLSDYFDGNPEDLEMEVTGFHYPEWDMASGECLVSFWGSIPGGGQAERLDGLVTLNKSSGYIQFVISYVGEG